MLAKTSEVPNIWLLSRLLSLLCGGFCCSFGILLGIFFKCCDQQLDQIENEPRKPTQEVSEPACLISGRQSNISLTKRKICHSIVKKYCPKQTGSLTVRMTHSYDSIHIILLRRMILIGVDSAVNQGSERESILFYESCSRCCAIKASAISATSRHP
jgi:hypothetical protein